MLENKSIIWEIKNAFDGLISRLNMAEERTSDFEAISIKIYQKKKKERERILNGTEYTRTVGQLQKVWHVHNWNTRRKSEKWTEDIFEK